MIVGEYSGRAKGVQGEVKQTEGQALSTDQPGPLVRLMLPHLCDLARL